MVNISTDKNKKRILIDISTIIPGQGGSGGGIWIYAKNLLQEYDRSIESNNVEIICLKNSQNNEVQLKNLQVILIDKDIKNPIKRFLWLQVGLPTLCKKMQIDVLHRMTPEMPLVKVCVYICTVHDLMFKFYRKSSYITSYFSIRERIKLFIFDILTVMAAKKADHVLTPSNSVKNELVLFYSIRKQKVRVTHLAASSKQNPHSSIHLAQSDIFNIIVVAGFYPHKGYDQILLVIQELLSRGISDIMVTFRGNPAYPQYLALIKSKICALGLSSHVRIAEFKKNHSLNEIYVNQHCFLLLSEYEGFGLPLLEAQQFYLPVICSDIPVFREVMNDSALYVSPRNIAEVCNGIIDLKNSSKLRMELIQKGLLNIQRFSWQKTSQETLMSYS